MDVSKDHASRHSENDFGKQFLMLVDSGAGVIHVRATEILRAVSCIRKTVLLDKGDYREWDIVNGIRTFSIGNYADEGVTGDGNADISAAFSLPLGAMRDGLAGETTKYFVYVNPHVYMENNPHMHQLLLMYNEFLPSCKICVVMVTPDRPLPESPASDSILSLHFTTPGLGELRSSLSGVIDTSREDFEDGIDLSEDERDRICYAGAGMTSLQFETYLSLAAVKSARNDLKHLDAAAIVDEVQIGKTEIVNQSDILELYRSSDILDVGGMENLKDWIKRRSGCYSDEAREFGVEPPKGMVLVGPPGTGKSLIAKAISSELGVPLIRLDFGRVFSSFVGSSEQRIRTALRQVEAMSPCVLFCDEIDKGLGGISQGSGSDSGVGMRVLGSFLTWLQECQHAVFTMVTANNIDGLPPELLRRGRFDAIFSTSMPNPKERREVLAIHLRKRNRRIEDFSTDEVDRILEACDRYVPAEIESAVKDALVNAYSDHEELNAQHIIDAFAVMVPLSKAFAAQIERMSDWSKNNATPVSLTEEQRKARLERVKNRVRVSNRRRA
jgi:ATP-dependent 26S proteasome regulatory subunit